ncbi:Rne/Rng family ribonuclease [Desulfomonile tiedjei]|uniref:Ribonuclease G n=1 Tax=Desulfomonile tiedjei (strain ATCC 49306 / DSM 6799 / DCB-1) TaxID=706587 RepID=I4C732_DESTA|nr:Rne/Rng family ribonuclease [Desulfomonile tiedjei]AFM25373.1 RNAse E [Desulfomonile tiedjei DSM 6799]
MLKKMLINASQPEECRVAVVCDGLLEELDVQVKTREATLGNIYKGVVTRVEPSLQAVFVDYGCDRNGFLSINDVHPSYFPESFEANRRRPRIQEVFKKEDHVLVQVNKEERNTKGACLTTNISLAGRYLVLMPGTSLYGVSRKIEDEKERKKLKEIVKQLKLPDNMGFIIRTAGMGRTKTELARDLNYLMKLWEVIETHVAESEAPTLLYREHDLVIRTIREHFSPDISEILVDEKDTYKRVRDFFHQVMPKYENLVKLYQEKRPLFNKYQLEEQLEQVYRKKIKLKSGGYIIIEQTEAMVTVDVNSGSATKEKGIEETAFRVNLEAAPEIARQLRLRDLGGIIVIDFIDMVHKKHNQEVEKAVKAVLKTDRAKTKILRISALGLLELSRQRLKSSLGTGEYMDCPLCDGHGRMKSPEMAALSVFRKIKSLLIKSTVSEVRATVPLKVGEYLLNKMRAQLVEMESQYNARVLVTVKENLPEKEILVEAVKEQKEEIGEAPSFEPALTAQASELAVFIEEEQAEIIPEPTEEEKPATTVAEPAEEKQPAKPKRKRRTRKKTVAAQETQIEEAEPVSEPAAEEAALSASDNGEEADITVDLHVEKEDLDFIVKPEKEQPEETPEPVIAEEPVEVVSSVQDSEESVEVMSSISSLEETVEIVMSAPSVEESQLVVADLQDEAPATVAEESVLSEHISTEQESDSDSDDGSQASDSGKKARKDRKTRKSLLQSYLPFS